MSPAPQEADLPPEMKEAEPDNSESGTIILSPEQRQQYLGKLAEFQLKLEELTEMQANFVLAVLRDPSNFEKAARAAGFKNPAVAAHRLRSKPAVAAAIAMGENLREDRTLPAYARRAISSVKWKHKTWTEDGELHTQTETELKLWNKNDALKMLAMYQKLLSGENGGNLMVDNSKHVHLHQHQHNTWQIGENKVTF
jgi:uncharacterized protein (UPF0147 family)